MDPIGYAVLCASYTGDAHSKLANLNAKQQSTAPEVGLDLENDKL